MRILIADDHDLVRDALALYVEEAGGITVRTVATLAEACDAIEDGDAFDLVLLDYRMPGMNGLDGLARVIGLEGGQRVALMSGEATREVAEKALTLGAAGFVPKTLGGRALIEVVRKMAAGERFVPDDFPATEMAKPAILARLTGRETDVLMALVAGKPNKQIARDLGLSEPTIKLHLKTMFRKMGVSNRTQAALVARDNGIGRASGGSAG